MNADEVFAECIKCGVSILNNGSSITLLQKLLTHAEYHAYRMGKSKRARYFKAKEHEAYLHLQHEMKLVMMMTHHQSAYRRCHRPLDVIEAQAIREVLSADLAPRGYHRKAVGQLDFKHERSNE